jgi:hypothetical protein
MECSCTATRDEIQRLGRCARVHGAPYVEALWSLYERAADEETRRAAYEALLSLRDGCAIPG